LGRCSSPMQHFWVAYDFLGAMRVGGHDHACPPSLSVSCAALLSWPGCHATHPTSIRARARWTQGQQWSERQLGKMQCDARPQAVAAKWERELGACKHDLERERERAGVAATAAAAAAAQREQVKAPATATSGNGVAQGLAVSTGTGGDGGGGGGVARRALGGSPQLMAEAVGWLVAHTMHQARGRPTPPMPSHIAA
jgi:hypothetical protein